MSEIQDERHVLRRRPATDGEAAKCKANRAAKKAAEAKETVPKFLTETLQGTGCQCVKLTFYKDNHMGVYIEGRRGTGAWEFLAIDTESPYIDQRPLLAAGTPEVREYRMRFWDKGTPNGDWTDVVKVTVSP
ncbi:MAG: hypothetical protein ACKVY0_05825 [Prosthecobacter sp.]|uniref:hypothetical protein n=1 Tax=Prosthecobacter sp. TaxID=1965333 RepID=UPI0038FEB8D6